MACGHLFICLENNLTMPYTLELLYPYILLYFTLRVLFTGDAFDAVKTPSVNMSSVYGRCQVSQSLKAAEIGGRS